MEFEQYDPDGSLRLALAERQSSGKFLASWQPHQCSPPGAGKPKIEFKCKCGRVWKFEFDNGEVCRWKPISFYSMFAWNLNPRIAIACCTLLLAVAVVLGILLPNLIPAWIMLLVFGYLVTAGLQDGPKPTTRYVERTKL